MSIHSPGLSRDDGSTSQRSQVASPNVPIKYAPLPDWFAISGMRRTATYEAIGRGDLRAIKLNGRTLIDVEHGLAYMARLPEAAITTGRRRNTQPREAAP